MQSIHNGVNDICEYCECEAATELHKEIFADMSSLSIIELKNIIVIIVYIKQLQKATFANMYSLFITVFNIVVYIVTTMQL